MAMISEKNIRRRQSFCLQEYFASRSKPFRRPQDLIHFVHCCVGKARLRTTKPPLCRLTVNKMASNLEGEIHEFTASHSSSAAGGAMLDCRSRIYPALGCVQRMIGTLQKSSDIGCVHPADCKAKACAEF